MSASRPQLLDRKYLIGPEPPAATDVSFGAWYRSALVCSIRYVVAEAVRTDVPVVMLAAAAYGVWRSRTRAEMAVLAGAGAVCLMSVPFNPVPSSFARVVLLPLVPVFCAIAQCAGESLLERKTAKTPVEPAPEAAVSR